jgi:hypothetical protein
MSIIPINSKTNGSLTTSFTASVDFKQKQPTPIIDENEIVLEVNGIGPLGPPGRAGRDGNGIERIEKTSTSGIVDTYTIYFTNGMTFNYDIVNGIIYYYDGPYDVTPMPYTAQILPTSNLAMAEDVNIREIPYYEVSNTSGGMTATIGDIN